VPKPNHLNSAQILTGRFESRPIITFIITNVCALLILAAIGFGLGMIFSANTDKLYGDHCTQDEECKAKMNYVCNLGKCECNTDTYYESASNGCGK
jgi:hypothetical protein